MQQHILHDAVRAPAVLDDLLQIALQRRRQIVDLGPQIGGNGEPVRRDRRVQLIQQIARQLGKIVDEVERVLDFVRDAGGELSERRHLLRLHQTVLSAAQIDQRGLGGGARAAGFLEQPRVLDGEHGLAGEGLHQGDEVGREAVLGAPADHQAADNGVVAQQWNRKHGMDARQRLGRIGD